MLGSAGRLRFGAGRLGDGMEDSIGVFVGVMMRLEGREGRAVATDSDFGKIVMVSSSLALTVLGAGCSAVIECDAYWTVLDMLVEDGDGAGAKEGSLSIGESG
jgi:hypothetical protein